MPPQLITTSPPLSPSPPCISSASPDPPPSRLASVEIVVPSSTMHGFGTSSRLLQASRPSPVKKQKKARPSSSRPQRRPLKAKRERSLQRKAFANHFSSAGSQPDGPSYIDSDGASEQDGYRRAIFGPVTQPRRVPGLTKEDLSDQDRAGCGAQGAALLEQFKQRQNHRRHITEDTDSGEVTKKRVKFGSVEFMTDKDPRPVGSRDKRGANGTVTRLPWLQTNKTSKTSTLDKTPPRHRNNLPLIGRPSGKDSSSHQKPDVYVSKNGDKLAGSIADGTLPSLDNRRLGISNVQSASVSSEDSESDEDEVDTKETRKHEISYIDDNDGPEVESDPTTEDESDEDEPSFPTSTSTFAAEAHTGAISAQPLMNALFPSSAQDDADIPPKDTPGSAPEHEFWEYTVYRNNWRRTSRSYVARDEFSSARQVSCGSYVDLEEANEVALAEALSLRGRSNRDSQRRNSSPGGLRMTEDLDLHVDTHDHGMLNVVLMHAEMSQVHVHVERCLRASGRDPRIALQQQIREGKGPDTKSSWKSEKVYMVWERVEVDRGKGGSQGHDGFPGATVTPPSSSTSSSPSEECHRKAASKDSPVIQSAPGSLISGPHTTLSSANEAAYKYFLSKLQQQQPHAPTDKTPKDTAGSVQRAEFAQQLRAHWQECERTEEFFEAEMEFWNSEGANSNSGSEVDGEKRDCAIQVWVEERKVRGPRN